MINLLLFLFISSGYCDKLPEEKEVEVIDFNSLKDVLKKDGLEKEAQKKQADIQKIQVERTKLEAKKYMYPTEPEFYQLANDYWLVKNAQWLKWDIEKPDYAIEKSFSELLEKLGIFGVRYNILIVDSMQIPHLALPSLAGPQLILSLPFIRTLDLSKSEISILLLEDMLRHQEKILLKACENPKIQELSTQNFEGKKADLSPVDQYAQCLMTFINEKGFSFQQQFLVTKKMDSLLKSTPELWNMYILLLNKIDRAIKSDLMFNNYNKLYPSPEMQIKWLAPSTKNS